MKTKNINTNNLIKQNSILIGIFLTVVYFTQVSFTNSPNEKIKTRTIEVTGSAEMAVHPDKIKLKIILHNYSSSKSMKEEKEFYKILKKNGVKEENIIMDKSINGWGWYWNWYYYRSLSRQNFTVTIDSAVNPKGLMLDLKKKWVKSISVSEKSNTKTQEYRKKVKIMAIKAAKEKATYLLEALGEKLDYVVSIKEITPENINRPYGYNPYYGGTPWNISYWNNSRPSSVSNTIVNSNQTTEQKNKLSGIATNKLRYEVKVVFTIQ